MKFDKVLKFPGKSDRERARQDESIIKASKRMELSQLDSVALSRIVEQRLWDEELVGEITR